jgi:hypothetical protein
MPNFEPNFAEQRIPWPMTTRSFFSENDPQSAQKSFGLTDVELADWKGRRIVEIGTGMGVAAQELVRAGYNLVATAEPGLKYEKSRDYWLQQFAQRELNGLVVPSYASELPQYVEPNSTDIIFALGINFQDSCSSVYDLILQHIGSMAVLKPNHEAFLTYWRAPGQPSIYRKFIDELDENDKWNFEHHLYDLDDTLRAIGARFEYRQGEYSTIRIYRLNNSGEDILPGLRVKYGQAKEEFAGWGIEHGRLSL